MGQIYTLYCIDVLPKGNITQIFPYLASMAAQSSSYVLNIQYGAHFPSNIEDYGDKEFLPVRVTLKKMVNLIKKPDENLVNVYKYMRVALKRREPLMRF